MCGVVLQTGCCETGRGQLSSMRYKIGIGKLQCRLKSVTRTNDMRSNISRRVIHRSVLEKELQKGRVHESRSTEKAVEDWKRRAARRVLDISQNEKGACNRYFCTFIFSPHQPHQNSGIPAPKQH